MNSGFAVLLTVLGIAVSAQAYAQDAAAPGPQAQVFPEPLCANLPEVGPELKTWVATVAPELAQVEVRALPEKTALDVFGRAAAAGWGSVDVLTNSVFREPCTFYFSQEALRAVDAAFVLDLVTAIRGQDTKGQAFEMIALLAGRGKLVVLYDRDGITYRNERLARDFKLASRVEFETPAAGVLENVQGLCAKVLLLGCVRVRSLMKVGGTIEVHAGTFTSETTLKPILPRAQATPLPHERNQTQTMNRKDSRITTSPRIDTTGATGDHAWRRSSADTTITAKNARRINDTMILWDRSRSYCGPAFIRRSRSGLS